MAYTPTRLYHAAPGTSNATLYTTTSRTVVNQVVVANTTATAATLRLTTNGSTAATALVWDASFPANSVTTLDLAFVLNATSETIQGLQGTASALSVSIHGQVIT